MSNWRGRKPVSSPYMQRSSGGVYRRDHVVVERRRVWGLAQRVGVEETTAVGDF